MYEKIRGNSLGNFLRSRIRYVHTSVHYIINPLKIVAEQSGEIFQGPEYILTRKDGTYNVGKNKAKGEKRALQGVRK